MRLYAKIKNMTLDEMAKFLVMEVEEIDITPTSEGLMFNKMSYEYETTDRKRWEYIGEAIEHQKKLLDSEVK